MRTRTIPALRTSVGAVGLGCMGMSWAYVPSEPFDDDAGIALIHRALELGVTLLDTSDFYGSGHNETLVGKALADRRDQAVLATKVGLVPQQDSGPARGRDGRPEHVRAAVDASLGRLGTDVIDLYYLHRVDPAVPLAETWGAMAELVQAGKVRALGLSEVTVDQAAEAQAIHPVAAIQSELSLWTRDPLGTGANADGASTGDVVGWCAAHEAIFVPFSPLGRGFLTGTLDVAQLDPDDFRAKNPRFAREAAEQNQAIVDAVRRIAGEHEVPVGSVALAWVLAQGEHVIPIPGTTKERHLRHNAEAADLELTADELATLDALPAPAGARY